MHLIDMTDRKSETKFDSAPACRAKAASFRTIAVHAVDPNTKARMLKKADEWDRRAAGYDRGVSQPD